MLAAEMQIRWREDEEYQPLSEAKTNRRESLHGVGTALMSALGHKRSFWIVRAMSALPQKRTFRSAVGMSAKGQKRTPRPVQTVGLFDKLIGA